MQSGEWGDLTIRAVSSDPARDQPPRRPPRAPLDDEAEEEAGAEVDLADSVVLGRGPAPSLETVDFKRAVRLVLVPLGLDLQTQWAALIEAAALEPALRFWRRQARSAACRLRRGGRLPLGLPTTAPHAFLSSQMGGLEGSD
jgi:hypothetical protein